MTSYHLRHPHWTPGICCCCCCILHRYLSETVCTCCLAYGKSYDVMYSFCYSDMKLTISNTHWLRCGFPVAQALWAIRCVIGVGIIDWLSTVPFPVDYFVGWVLDFSLPDWRECSWWVVYLTSKSLFSCSPPPKHFLGNHHNDWFQFTTSTWIRNLFNWVVSHVMTLTLSEFVAITFW